MSSLPSDADWQACGNGLSAYPLLQERLQAAGRYACTPLCSPKPPWSPRSPLPRPSAARVSMPPWRAPLYIRDKVAKTVAERLNEGGRA